MDKEWNVCRICLKDDDELCSIYDEIDENPPVVIAERIMSCSSLIITKDCNLPEEICVNCLDDLQTAYKFRLNCENSEAILYTVVRCAANDDDEDTNVDEQLQPKQEYNEKSEVIVKKEDEIINLPTEDIVTPFQDKYFVYDNYEELESIIEENNEPTVDDIFEMFTDDGTENQENDSMLNENEYQILNVKPIRTNKTSTRRKLPTIEKADSSVSKSMKVCVLCGNEYKYNHSLESHMRRHRNEKPFRCKTCGKGFVIKFELNRHMRTHTGQKPYACQYCDRRFSDFGSRVKHERTHTGERPYSCDVCNKTFTYSHVLSSHMLTHTGEKRFECVKCLKRFAKSHHLKAHLTTHDKHENLLLSPITATDPIINEQNENNSAMMNDRQEYNITPDMIVYNNFIMAPTSTEEDIAATQQIL